MSSSAGKRLRRGGSRHRRPAAWGAVGLCLFTACQALVNYERSPAEPARDAASDGQAEADPGAGGAGGTASTAPPADATPAAVPAPAAGAPDPCSPNPELDVRESCCGAYCELFFQVCAGLPAVGSYTDALDCANRCYNASEWPLGTITQSGSIACRNYHSNLALTAATPMLRELHCGHAGEVPTPGGC